MRADPSVLLLWAFSATATEAIAHAPTTGGLLTVIVGASSWARVARRYRSCHACSADGRCVCLHKPLQGHLCMAGTPIVTLQSTAFVRETVVDILSTEKRK